MLVHGVPDVLLVLAYEVHCSRKGEPMRFLDNSHLNSYPKALSCSTLFSYSLPFLGFQFNVRVILPESWCTWHNAMEAHRLHSS